MGKLITGTKSLGAQQGRIIKASGNNVSKIRCPFCQHTMAHPRPDGHGKKKHKCMSCGREFSFSPL